MLYFVMAIIIEKNIILSKTKQKFTNLSKIDFNNEIGNVDSCDGATYG